MALGLPTAGGGERVPIIKYDARAGRIFRVDRTQNAAGAWDSANVEITQIFQAVFDLEKIELGWLHFPTNGAPDMALAPYGQPIPAKPSPNHRAGFRVNVLLGKAAGGDVREMAANASASIAGMDELHDAYLAAVKANPGKLPVVRLAGTKMITSQGKAQSSTNFQPVWEIVAWVDRPEKLSEAAIAALRSGAPKEAAATGGADPAAAAPPAPPPVPADVSSDF